MLLLARLPGERFCRICRNSGVWRTRPLNCRLGRRRCRLCAWMGIGALQCCHRRVEREHLGPLVRVLRSGLFWRKGWLFAEAQGEIGGEEGFVFALFFLGSKSGILRASIRWQRIISGK